jgi:hypothetical protein
MSSSLKEHLAEMNYAMKPSIRSRGISKIPDDILARIFECIYEPWATDSEVYPELDDLRLVCKRFQQVADLQPSLRRNFTSTMAIKKIENRLDRCGQMGLRVKILDHSYETDARMITAFADALTPHAHRWEELHFFHIKSTQAVEQAFDKFKALNLPRLERLVLWSQDWDAADSIYSTWTMPNLRRIVIHDGVPLALPGKADLSECDAVLEGDDIPGFLLELPEFLGSSTSLTTLSLTFNEATFTCPFDFRAKLKFVHLPNLRTFHVDACFNTLRNDKDASEIMYNGQAILILIDYLKAPKLEQFSVVLDNETCWRRWTSGFLSQWLRVHGKASSLQTFAFTEVRYRAYDDVESIVDNPCNGNIVMSGLDLDVSRREKLPKSRTHQEGPYRLRTLTFKNCRLSTRALESLLQLYTTRELYPNFEGIILTQCDGVTWETLAGVAHSKHVFFRED